jgi:4-amino-4-deoxy-L-arabinose transferase-like glycosyltransferase
MEIPWKRVIPVAALLAFAFAARVAMLVSLKDAPLLAEPILDSAAYDRWAQEIATKSFWGDRAFYQDPLYPYALGVFYKVIGRHLFVVRLLQASVGVLGLWFLFEAARRLQGYAVAVATLAVAAVYRTTTLYDVVLLKEFLGPFFLEAALLCGALALSDKRWWWWVLTGVAVGLASLVRGNLLVLVPALAVALWFMRERRGAGYLLAGAALAILPCTIRNAVVARDFVVTTAQAGPNLYIGNNPDNWSGRYRPPKFLEYGAPDFEESAFRREAMRRTAAPTMKASEVSAYWRGEALSSMREDVWGFAGATFRRTMLLFNDWEVPDNFSVSFMRRFSVVLALPWMTFGLVLWPLAAAGLYFSWLERRKHVLAYVLLLGALVPVAFFFVFDRYRLPAIPLLFFFAGYALVKFWETWHWHMRRVPVAALTVAAIALVHANIPASVYGVGDTGFATQHLNLANWHRDHGQPASAAQSMDQVFALRPELRKRRDAARLAADCYVKANRAPEALPLYVEAGDYAGAGDCYLALGSPADAAKEYGRAVVADPENIELRLKMAAAMSKAGLRVEALEALSRTASMFPNDARPPLACARLYRELKMWREAITASDSALRIDPLLREAYEIKRDAETRLKGR